jgi:hypothetical protein
MYYGEPEPSYYAPQPRRQSGFGIASFAISLLSGLMMIGFCGLAAWAGSQSGTDPLEPVTTVAAWSLCGCSLLANLVGVVFGIIGVAQKDVSKVFGILGLVFNGLILLAYLGLVLLVALGMVVFLGAM